MKKSSKFMALFNKNAKTRAQATPVDGPWRPIVTIDSKGKWIAGVEDTTTLGTRRPDSRRFYFTEILGRAYAPSFYRSDIVDHHAEREDAEKIAIIAANYKNAEYQKTKGHVVGDWVPVDTDSLVE